jgi:hypothetical protein
MMARAQPKLDSDRVEIHDVEQGGDDWFQLRLGIPTASEFATVMASGIDGGDSLGRQKLLYRLAGEVLTGIPGETYRNSAMERGKEMEPEACEHYAFTRGVELARVGFVLRTIPGNLGGPALRIGCSPDRFVGKSGVLETKTMRPDLLIALALRGAAGFPTEHRAQCQGILWVTGREWVDLEIFYRKMPVAPTFRVERDDAYIRQIADAVEVFDYDLRKLVERVRAMGGAR